MGIAKNNSSQGISENSGIGRPKPEGKSKRIQGPTGRSDHEPSNAERVWQVVASIPAGYVATYGQIARIAGLPGYARFVGTTLGKLPRDTRLPWHRVVNASLKIAPRSSDRMREQKKRLREEGARLTGDRVTREHHWPS